MREQNKIRNPILPGFFPDPSICRVNGEYYLVTSSMELYPGIPVFHSRDLANWEQIGNALCADNDFFVYYNCGPFGVMAPTIRYSQGKYYIIVANFCDKGNCIVTADNPAGPWSKPYWLEDVPGIDASLFFADDGQAYVVGTKLVDEERSGNTEPCIWVSAFNTKTMKRTGPRKSIWQSAMRDAHAPEAPHLYYINGWYYLIIAEGGTGHYHSVTVARSKTIDGWYEGYQANPILTHRHLGRNCDFVNIGHADLIDTPDGAWYAVMLGSRTIEGYHKNLGRETFICPVKWEDAWPLMSPQSGRVNQEYPADTSLPWTEFGTVRGREDFCGGTLAPCWVMLGTPSARFMRLENSRLWLECVKHPVWQKLEPIGVGTSLRPDSIAFVGRRQMDIDFTACCVMEFIPNAAEAAGFIVLQACNHHLRLERCLANGQPVIRLVLLSTKMHGLPFFSPEFESDSREVVLGQVPFEEEKVVLGVTATGQSYSFFYDNGARQYIAENIDARAINPENIGGFMGTLVGMYATSNGEVSENQACFDWFEYNKL